MNTDNTIHVDDIDGCVPPDATHYEDGTYYKKTQLGWTYRWRKTWVTSQRKTCNLEENLQKIIRTPKEAPVKDEPYVPKVGEECEIYWVAGEISGWVNSKIKYMGSRIVVYETVSGEHSSSLNQCEFRPIRTEEDKKRDWLKENQPGLPADEQNKDAINAYLDIYTENLIKAGVTLPESES